MKLAGVAVGIKSVVVVDAIGCIACLLYFKYEVATAQTVDVARRKEEYVVFIRIILAQIVDNGVVVDCFAVFVGAELAI